MTANLAFSVDQNKRIGGRLIQMIPVKGASTSAPASSPAKTLTVHGPPR